MAVNGRELGENSVAYRLYPSSAVPLDSLNDYIQKCYTYLAKHISHHIWHNQSFHLSVATDSSGVHHLSGVTDFGENIEDEWLVVYLLYRLSRLDPLAVIHIEDTDGQFLLIEAADYLPKWCEPSNCQNRVFIYKEAVHIIPIKCKEFAGREPTIAEAVAYVRQYPDVSRAQELIQKAIRKRIDCFPKRITEWQHRTHCYVPVGVAALLRHRPALISWAVQAFYNRTPDDLKACQAMKYFPPESRVMRCLSITRCLYAQLMSQKYSPDVRVGWDLPPNNSRHFRCHDLGMKIASGFEILISNSRSLLTANGATNPSKELASDRRWIAFLESLAKNGYFGNERNGSRKYNDLLKCAQNYFTDLLYNNENSHELTESYESRGEKIHQILRSLDIDVEEFESEAKRLPAEDSDDWMTVNADELDAMLTEKFCSKPTNQTTDCSDISTQIPSTLEAFVSNSRSGLRGAEAPKPPPRKRRTQTQTASKIQFNEDSFTDALSTVLSLKIPHSETDSSSSGMSDYSDDEDSIDSDDDCYQKELFKSVPKTNGTTNGLMDDMKEYMKAMDQQLAQTSVGQSFERRGEGDGESALDGDYKAVDIDLNALTNILESYGAECGVPGPATALFSTMGVKLPDNADTDSDDD